MFGAPKAGPGQWASCVRLLDPIKGEILQLIKLEQNEAAVSMTLVRFANWPDALYCLVGVAKDLHLNPRSVQYLVGMGQSKKWFDDQKNFPKNIYIWGHS